MTHRHSAVVNIVNKDGRGAGWKVVALKFGIVLPIMHFVHTIARYFDLPRHLVCGRQPDARF